jgi:DNA mismatch repair protein MutH
MKLEEALPALQKACRRPFRELFAGHPEDLRTNKGNVGQLLLRYIGLDLDSKLTDFSDGELKTNKARPDGMPVETMFITQISANIDSLIGVHPLPFVDSNLHRKTRNLVYLPVVKASEDAADWYFTDCIHIQVLPGTQLFERMREDYEAICKGLRAHIALSADGFIHTTNGPHYVQVRSKDSKPYHPIYSAHYGRHISNKNHALYFRKEFMVDAFNKRL